jgi:hypothetical protein
MDNLLADLITNLDEVRTIAQEITKVSPVDSHHIQIAAEAKNIYNICGYWQSMATAAVPASIPPIPVQPIPQPPEG